ncbi:phenylalanine ammonia-lyase [Lentithecium fluviatile CBS 122367]|uniref:Phenylalanine ammonia-lyase n=1 Tax=Lentithecium fluviatile CBS 122367 TaxID=1168545 RepID=A0A6G1IV78_9PLEO|nr:phenylalanine ammonia-lyase [Lentithecium fluviatile CBS 122367]
MVRGSEQVRAYSPPCTTHLAISAQNSTRVVVDGESLDIAKASFVGKHKVNASLSDDAAVRNKIDRSVDVLNQHLAEGRTVYGVNTGYGGSADVRCEPHEMHTLQQAFLQHLNCGILPTSPPADSPENAHSSSLKEQWVRAAMLIRANSVARGHSAVRSSTIVTLLELLNREIIPIIPTRGSISASGDLSPLSYVAGMLEGNPGVYCWAGPPGSRHATPASKALASANITPITFEPKEALGLVNGTAISAAAASLTLSSMHNLFALGQLLTAMNVEAILGTATSFAPFISRVRPHPGQAQVASTIFSALKYSKLATGLLESQPHTLAQDRYSLRTVPQWLGPFLEDLLFATEQLTVELNSTTDNPLIDPDTGAIYHGGNFQAVSVTSAMEKCRLAAQAIGRMLFSQFTEMVNPATNRGLPPNLCADEPSTSFTMKGVDTNMAAYMSELSFLANPVHNHVVCAEMGNQALNSLALVSARYTDSAVDILSIMCACTLYGVSQALDLRAMHCIFEEKLQYAVHQTTATMLQALGTCPKAQDEASEKVWQYIHAELEKTTTLDTNARFAKIITGAKAPLLSVLEEEATEHPTLLSSLKQWTERNTATAVHMYNTTRTEYLATGSAAPLLGRASKRLYSFVRQDLKVPMHRGVVDHPMYKAPASSGVDDTWRKKTIGHWISVIHGAIKSERVMDVVVECLREGLEEPGGGEVVQLGKANGTH